MLQPPRDRAVGPHQFIKRGTGYVFHSHKISVSDVAYCLLAGRAVVNRSVPPEGIGIVNNHFNAKGAADIARSEPVTPRYMLQTPCLCVELHAAGFALCKVFHGFSYSLVLCIIAPMAKAPEYSIAKLAPPETNSLAYPTHDRANDLYGMWMTGYTEDEISAFMGLSIEETQKDLMYVNTRLSTRQIIHHNNERQRIMLQRQNSEDFRRLMSESLQTPARVLIDAGLSPAGILKEYRESTGMVQKAEPLIQVNTQINNAAPTGGVTSAEDVIRRVLSQINQEPSPLASQPEEPEIIDAEVEQISEDSVPGLDERD
jgi:hypothetical protein